MRYRFLLFFMFCHLQAQAHWGEYEYDVIDFDTCSVFKISSEFNPDLSGHEDEEFAFENMQKELNKKYGDGYIFTSYGITFTNIENDRAHAVCDVGYNWFTASPDENNLSFRCKGSVNFPIESGAIFTFNGGKNRWSAKCIKDCGKSKKQKLYWVDTREFEDGGERTINRGYERDRRKLEKRCFQK